MRVAGQVDVGRIEAFLFEEAALLDDWRLDEWLELFTEDARYVVPATDLPSGDPKRDLVLIVDDMRRLRGRVARLNDRRAHREFPHSRTRRLITNVRLVGTALGGQDVEVEANFIVYRFRTGAGDPYVGRYRYLLRPHGRSFRIVERRAELDQEALQSHGTVSIIV
jgi:p-cumate 2,3-dioxygenase subunit beta